MSELVKQVVFFFVLLAVFIGCILVVPSNEGRMIMGLVAVFTLYGVVRRFLELWRNR